MCPSRVWSACDPSGTVVAPEKPSILGSKASYSAMASSCRPNARRATPSQKRVFSEKKEYRRFGEIHVSAGGKLSADASTPLSGPSAARGLPLFRRGGAEL